MNRRAFLRLAALAPVVGPTVLQACTAPIPAPATAFTLETSVLGSSDVLTRGMIDKAIARARIAARPTLWVVHGTTYYVVPVDVSA